MSRVAADASVFHAIADPTRRAILDLLRDGERSVGEMTGVLLRGAGRLTQSAFSQHLAVLRRAGLVAAEKKGRRRVYRFNAAPLSEVAAWIAAYDRFWTARLESLGRYLGPRRTG